MRLKVILFALACPLLCYAQTQKETAGNKKFEIAKDIVAEQLSANTYLYTATAVIGKWGPVPSNGMIVVDKGKAFLFDTPIDNEQTATLVDWISNTLHAKVVGFVPNHWHDDCVGGLEYLHKKHVKSYANRMTVDLLKEKGLPAPQHAFKDSLNLKLNDLDIRCYYLGGGHSTDNIVVWLPSEKILFGGCMIKDNAAQSMGNLSDAAVSEWPATLGKVLTKFPDAQIVIPGHGQYGGLEIVKHTKKLTENYIATSEADTDK